MFIFNYGFCKKNFYTIFPKIKFIKYYIENQTVIFFP